MEDEFDQLMKILSKEEKERDRQLEDIFQRCTECFERYQYVLASGTQEEKEVIRKKMLLLQEKLREEGAKSEAKLGITPEQASEVANDPKNFTKEQWEFLQKAKEKLTSNVAKKEKPKKKPGSRKSSWMKS